MQAPSHHVDATRPSTLNTQDGQILLLHWLPGVHPFHALATIPLFSPTVPLGRSGELDCNREGHWCDTVVLRVVPPRPSTECALYAPTAGQL